MNLLRRWIGAGLITVGCLSSLSGHAQFWTQIILEQNVTPELVSADKLPRYGTFWTLQRTNSPPLPFYAPFLRDLDAPVYVLDAQQNIFLVDDSAVDYVALYQQREVERVLRQVEWENGLLTDAQYWALEGGSPQMALMTSSLASTFAYGNPVYLVDMAATNAGAQAVSASFSIAGGTNNVPYDILKSTNAASPIADWQWLGIGYTSNRYTFSNQPLNQAFYVLAKPQKTMTVGWGTNGYNQAAVPAGTTNALMVAGGLDHSIALLADGDVLAWGTNNYGQGSVPTNVVGASMVAAGWHHNVALLTNGSLAAWGLNLAGVYNLTTIPTGATNVAVISAQALHSLALRSNGTVVAWGYNTIMGETNVPTGLSNVVAIAAGYQHNLAAKSDGSVVAWGNHSDGQCDVPSGLSNVVDVAAGLAHSLALRRDGTVVAWGRNTYGETNVPTGLTNVVAIAAGGDPQGDAESSFSLALKNDGTVVAWGSGKVVTPLGGMSNVIAIAAGTDHALAIRSGPRTPVLTLLPVHQFQLAGGNVTFTAKGAGLYGVTYQWKTNGVNMAGATNATLTLTNVQAAQTVDYAVTVSNEVGPITSPSAHLYLVTTPIIVTQTPMPTNQTAIFQENLTLSVVAYAPGYTNGFPLSYQWKFYGTNLPSATTNSFTLLGTSNALGACSVTITNAKGSVTVGWQVTNMTYFGSYVAPGTLAYHLATNAVGRTNGFTPANMVEVTGWSNATYVGAAMTFLTNSTWSTNFWLKGVKGLSATCIGFSNAYSGQGIVTMISPRHCLFASHMHTNSDYFVAAFLGTNNVIYWRKKVDQVYIGNDTSVGILDSDLPSAVGFLPVVPTNVLAYLHTNTTAVVQGIGMNQNLKLFSVPMTFGNPPLVSWSSSNSVPFGLGTNWNISLGGGDSSAPEMLLIGNQLVLFSHNWHESLPAAFGDGPNYAVQFDAVNQAMLYLTANNPPGTNCQLTLFSLTNWPSLH